MICAACRVKRHDVCINKYRPDPDDPEKANLIERPEPIKSCACQHQNSWNYVKRVQKETKDNYGDGKES